jgi:hypothetical protein
MIDQDIVLFGKPKKLENPTLQKPSVAIFSGPTGAGKTTQMFSYLIAQQKANQFQRAMVVSSNKVDPMLDNLSDDVKITNDPDEIREYIEEIKSTKKSEIKDNPSILIFDDCQGSNVINIQTNKLLNSFTLSHRHYNTWLVFCVQTFKNSMSTAIRKMGSLLFIFPPRNEGELQAILADLPIEREKLKRGFELVSRQPNTPLYINLQGKPRLFSGFKEEIDNFN